MPWQRLAATSFIILIKIIPASTSTIFLSYGQVNQDWNCQTVFNTFTSYAPYTQCYTIPPAASVKVVQQDAYCPGLASKQFYMLRDVDGTLVTIYSDPNCNYNAEVAPLNACESPYTIQSYSVYCHYPSTTINAPSTVVTSPTTAAQIPSPSPVFILVSSTHSSIVTRHHINDKCTTISCSTHSGSVHSHHPDFGAVSRKQQSALLKYPRCRHRR